MPEDSNDAVLGSIVQRTFVPSELSTHLSVITLPWDDLKCGEAGLPTIVSALTGTARADLLTDREFAAAIAFMRDPDFFESILDERLWRRAPFPWREMVRRYGLFPWPSELDPFLVHDSAGRFDNENPSARLGEMVIAGQLSGWQHTPQPTWTVTSERLRSSLRERQVSMEALATTARLLLAWTRKTDRVSTSLTQLGRYDIPYGNSPETKSETLRNMIQNARSVVVAPLVAGGLQSSSYISTGQYAAAFQCAVTAGAVTLLLVGSVGLADLVVDFLSRRRK